MAAAGADAWLLAAEGWPLVADGCPLVGEVEGVLGGGLAVTVPLVPEAPGNPARLV
ncbi:hypothetical protein [Kitasatospora sp. NPDC001175]|uniref:hypothetical protein n=1 Tax=Kitasatospora sp. NPDC001175 TaxID=3157103 RepID=UPI003CFDB931